MGLYENLPYVNFHELNLDDLMREVKEIKDEVELWEGDVDQAVANYIADHPEIMITPDSVYTAAIQDGAVTREKLDPVLQAELGYYVTPLMFGAAADGETDDRAAFQAAFDSGYDVYVPTDHGETYCIWGPEPVDVGGVPVEPPALIWRNTVTIEGTTRAAGRKLYGLGNWRTVGSRGCVKFKPYGNSATQPLIRVENGVQGFHIANLRFINHTSTNHGVFLDAATSATIDKDIIISDCSIVDFTLGIDFRGRGLTCYNDSFNSVTDAVHINYTGSDAYGSRAIWFEGCRFHTVTEKVIEVQSGSAYGLRVNGCLCDNGVKMFLHSAAGVAAKNWSITNNTLQDMDRKTDFIYTMWFEGPVEDMIISNNMFDVRNTSNGPTSVLKFDTTASGVVINGNRIDALFYNGKDSNNYRAFVFGSASNNIVICGNNLAGILSEQFLMSAPTSGCRRFCITGNVCGGEILPGTVTLDHSIIDNNITYST